ncbi:MAG: CP12 domain-containing protein [Candidatus Nanopelagicaceae bacterium]
MENIDKHIETDKQILDDPQTSPQARRHTQEELTALEAYKANHPGEDHDPTPLELFCDSNPAALECRVYDD